MKILACLAILGLGLLSGAQMTPPARTPMGGIDKTKGIGVDQKLGSQVPLSLSFTNSQGQQVNLSQYFGKVPVILNLVYFRCKSVCTLETQDLAQTVGRMDSSSTAPHLGDKFIVLTVSINPQENSKDSSAKKAQILSGFTPVQASNWHFLTGSEASIQSLVSAVGFHFTYEPTLDLINHPATLIMLSPKGVVTQYFFGDQYPVKVLSASLGTAVQNKIGHEARYIFFGCLCQDPITGKLSLNVMRIVDVFCVLTVLAISGTVITLKVKNRHHINNLQSRNSDDNV